MIRINETVFSDIYNLARFQEITADRIANTAIKDVSQCTNWKYTKRLRNNYQHQHATLNLLDNNTVYRNDWYGKISDYKDPIISPINFLEELISKLKGKISDDKIADFICLWFGSSGLKEIQDSYLKNVIYGLKNEMSTKITSSEDLVLDSEKLKNVYKDGNANLKYFDKCTKLK